MAQRHVMRHRGNSPGHHNPHGHGHPQRNKPHTSGFKAPPSWNDLESFNVNRPDVEGIRQSLYDTQTYLLAGVSTLSFFTTPKGGAKTLSQTNLVAAGTVPAMQNFLVQSIELEFYQADPLVGADLYKFYAGNAAAGNLVLTVGSKPYLQEAPLLKFAPKTKFQISVAAAGESLFVTGRPYLIDGSPLRLISNQNFDVTLNWPTPPVLSKDATIVCRLDGFMYRHSQ